MPTPTPTRRTRFAAASTWSIRQARQPVGAFPWLAVGLFLFGGGIDLGFQMGIEGRSLGEVNWLRVDVSAGTSVFGGYVGQGLRAANLGGRTAFALGATADFGVGEIAGYGIEGVARGIGRGADFNIGINRLINPPRHAKNDHRDAPEDARTTRNHRRNLLSSPSLPQRLS